MLDLLFLNHIGFDWCSIGPCPCARIHAEDAPQGVRLHIISLWVNLWIEQFIFT